MPMPGVRFATLLLLGCASVTWAGPRLERVAFRLTGPSCAAQYPALSASLSAVEGVRHTDFTLVPEHLIVDIDTGMRTSPDLTALIMRILQQTGCRAEPMESCITATPLAHHADIPSEARGDSH